HATDTFPLVVHEASPISPSTSRTVTAAVAPGADVKTIVCTVAGPNLSVTPSLCGPSTTFTIPAAGWDGDYVVTVTVTDHAGNSATGCARYSTTEIAPTVN